MLCGASQVVHEDGSGVSPQKRQRAEESTTAPLGLLLVGPMTASVAVNALYQSVCGTDQSLLWQPGEEHRLVLTLEN